MAGPVESIGVSNAVEADQKNTKTIDKSTLLLESNKIDYNLNKVDEKKFLEFKKMADYIKENGGEYEEEYKKIMEERIKPFEKQLQDILSKNNKSKESKDYSSQTDEEIAEEADEIINKQPEELRKQQALIAEINNNGTPEEINKLNEIMTEGMAEVQSFWDKINNKE